MVEGSPKERLTIEERAARRAGLSSDGSDRYDRLVDTLRDGREAPTGREKKYAVEWNPVARKLLIAAIAVALAYIVIRAGLDLVRERRIDTWNGPDATVQSGQRLADCPALNALSDDVFPTWIRFGGRLYGIRDERRVVVELPGFPGPTKSGYTLGEMQLLLDDISPQGKSREFILLWLPSSTAGQVFRPVPECN
jgi:hypothetical protein